MKSLMGKTLLMSLLALSFTVTACKKDEDEGPVEDEVTEETTTEENTDETSEEGTTEEETTEEETSEEETTEEADAGADTAEEDAGAEEVAVDESLFIKALYEVTCVQAQIEDIAKQKEIIAEVHARYGFDAESFKKAQDQIGEKDNVSLALKARMEKCTKEAAEGFAKAGSSEEGSEEEGSEETTEEDKKPKPKPRAYKVGRVQDRGVSAGDISGASVVLNFARDGKIKGYFKGKRSGKAFNVPLKGTVSKKDGSFSISGRMGQSRVKGRGTANKTGEASGSLSGSIFSKGFRARFKAR